MTRYLRFGYLIPRLVLLLVLGVAAEFGAGWALRWAAVNQGSLAVGAKVELGETSVSMLQTRAVVRDLRIANPDQPMENLLEAERIEVDFDAAALSHASVIADQAVISGLQFNTPRTKSGALDPTENPGGDAPAWLGDSVGQRAEDYASSWLSDLEGKLTGQLDEFQSPALAQQLADAWPTRIEALREEARAIKAEFESLRSLAADVRTNPLRNYESLASAPARTKALQERLAAYSEEVASLPQTAAADRRRVDLARIADQERLRVRLQADQLDPDALTSQLLGEQVTGAIDQLVGWVRWSREVMGPAKPQAITTPSARGVDVHFVGSAQRPDLLIREAQFSGVGDLFGGAVELHGRLTDLCTAPRAHGAPTRLTMRTTGAAPLDVTVELDRTGPTPVDVARVVCKSFPTPQLKLGDANRLSVVVDPTTASLLADLRVEGETVEGVFSLDQETIAVRTVTGASANRLTEEFGAAVAQQLGRPEAASTRIEVAGTLDNRSVKVESELGERLAKAIGSSASGMVTRRIDDRWQAAERRVAAQLASVEQQVDAGVEELLGLIDGPKSELQALAGAWSPGSFPNRSFAVEQIGRRLGLPGIPRR